MITKKEIQQLSDEDLTYLLSHTLMHVLCRQGSEEWRIPEGIELTVQTDNLKFKFNIDVDVKFTDQGIESFKNFCYSKKEMSDD